MKRKDALIIIAGVLLGLTIGGFIIYNSNNDIQKEIQKYKDLRGQLSEEIFEHGKLCIELGHSAANSGISLEDITAQYVEIMRRER